MLSTGLTLFVLSLVFLFHYFPLGWGEAGGGE